MALSGDGHRSVVSSARSVTPTPLDSCLTEPVVAAVVDRRRSTPLMCDRRSEVASPSVPAQKSSSGDGATKRARPLACRGAGSDLPGEQRVCASDVSSPSRFEFQRDSLDSTPVESTASVKVEDESRREKECERRVARTLVMGSCDPHGLQLDDDRAPTCARRPAFAIATHLPADAQELAGRPLPPLNQAEEMEPLPPPSALPPSPPCVTQLSQVVAPKGLALVRTWMRRLRRSLRAAQRGDTRLAKRLRPADLWLGVEYMTPEARDWNWDLRPLALGQTAIPLAVSGRDGLEPPSSFDRSELGKDDSAFKDQAILSEMAQGMRDDSDCRRGTLLCAPHGSALEHFAVAEEKIAKGVTNGWLSAGWELPCWPIRTAPYGVVDESERAGEPKHRFTNDLSWPQQSAMLDDDGVPVDSLNGAMRREEWPRNRLMRIYEFSEGAAILGTAKARVELWGIDVKAYYRAFGRQGSEIWRSAFVDASGFTLDERCCFGSAADACKCARVSNYLAWQTLRALRAVDKAFPSREPHVLAWQAERRRLGRAAGATEEEIAEQWEALHTFGYYIDDGACASIADLLCYSDGSPVIRDGKQVRRSQLHFEAAKGVLKRFGLESATNKEQPPARSTVTLGIELNLDTNRMRVSEDKRKKYASRAGAMAELQTCGREEMVALLSRLQFAATCYPRGRQWLHAPWRAVRAQWRLRDGKVLVTKAVRRSLRKWARELNSPLHEGVPLASRAIREWGEGVCAIYADASGEQGWMAWSEHNGELLFTDGVWNEAVKGLPICDKELLASTWGLVALAPWTGAHQVMSFTDNTVAQAAMRSHTPSAAAMAHLVERRSEWLLERGYLESVHRITSKANLWADMGSRGDTGGVLLQALALGYKPRRLEVDEEWLRLAADAAQIRERESESECRADGKGIAGSPCTSSVPIPDCRKRTRAIGEGTKPSHREVDEQAIDGGLGGPTRRSDPDRREALAQVQPLRAQHGANTTSRSRCTSGVEARGGNASDELRRVVGVVQAERKIHLAGIGEEVCGAGDRMDAEGAYGALCRGSRTLQVAGSREGNAARNGRAPKAGAMGCENPAATRGDGQMSAAQVLGGGSGMEGGADAGLLPAATRWRGSGAEWGAVQPTSASNQGGYTGDPSEGWIAGVEASPARSEEACDDGKDIHRLPTRRRETDRCGERSVALSQDGSRRTRDGETYTSLQTRERRGLPSRGRRGDGEADNGVDWIGSGSIWSAQSSNWRSDGGAGGGSAANTNQGVGKVELRYLRDLLPALARGGGRDGSPDRLHAIRGRGAGRVCDRGSGGDKPRARGASARRAGPRVGRGRALSTYVVGRVSEEVDPHPNSGAPPNFCHSSNILDGRVE